LPNILTMVSRENNVATQSLFRADTDEAANSTNTTDGDEYGRAGRNKKTCGAAEEHTRTLAGGGVV
jgi:hypothetical protein